MKRPDYSCLKDIKTSNQIKEIEKNEVIQKDIDKIDDVINCETESELLKLHRYLDGKYQTCITDWGISMYSFNKEYGFIYDFLDISSLKDNLNMMKAKLEGFILGFNINSSESSKLLQGVNVSVSNQNFNENNISINISFETARSEIEGMTALNQKDTSEIVEKINDLEKIMKSKISKKSKWEKVKPIILFATDKGLDVAITILSLVLQMKLDI